MKKDVKDYVLDQISKGERFRIDLKSRSLRIGKRFAIKDGVCNMRDYEVKDSDFSLDCVEDLFVIYKYSLPSERSDFDRHNYFFALDESELSYDDMLLAPRREPVQFELEYYILSAIINGKFTWTEDVLGGEYKWFWRSNTHKDLIILKEWIAA